MSMHFHGDIAMPVLKAVASAGVRSAGVAVGDGVKSVVAGAELRVIALVDGGVAAAAAGAAMIPTKIATPITVMTAAAWERWWCFTNEQSLRTGIRGWEIVIPTWRV